MNRERLAISGAAAIAGVAFFVGLAALKWYLWDIVFQEAGESDRSMLLWGIPIVFVGIASLAVGSSLAAFIARRIRDDTGD